jgi:AcrR family transcriptional regulator
MRRTKKEAAQTKVSILDAALDLFYVQGVTNTSLEEIAHKADVTRGAIYWHFKNKIEILEALFDSVHQPFVDLLTEGLKQSYDCPIRQLQQIFQEAFEELKVNARKQKLLFLYLFARDTTVDSGISKNNLVQRKRENLLLIERYFVNAIAVKALRSSVNATTMAIVIDCFLRGLLSELLDPSKSLHPEIDSETVLKEFFSSLYN